MVPAATRLMEIKIVNQMFLHLSPPPMPSPVVAAAALVWIWNLFEWRFPVAADVVRLPAMEHEVQLGEVVIRHVPIARKPVSPAQNPQLWRPNSLGA
jgi:hypothetical protein